MKKTLIIFLSCWALFVCALLTVIWNTEQVDLHQTMTLGWLSHFDVNTNAIQDVFFKYVTELGASVPFIVAFVLLFYKVGYSVFILASQAMTALVVYPIKAYVAAPRPITFFKQFPDVVLHQVDGVQLHLINSFPSGHTAAAFSLMLCLAVLCRKKTWTAPLFFVLAVIAAYSRVYLSQHFMEDICGGAVVGVCTTLLVLYVYNRKTFTWENKSIQNILIRK